jgi:NTE family protein
MDADLLRQLPLFESLAKEARRFVAQRLRPETFTAGELIVHQGEAGDSLYIITNGLVKVTKRSKDGASRELARLKTGDYFGEMSVLAGQPRSADIIAVTDTSTLVLCKKEMEEILREYPSIAVHFSKILSKRLRDVSQLNAHPRRKVSVISLYSRHLDPHLQEIMATNLAVSFSKELMKKTLLLDVSEHAGESLKLLRLTPSDTLVPTDILDSGDASPFIRKHSSGIHLLSLQVSPKFQQRTLNQSICPLLDRLKHEYDYILINCSSHITHLVQSALEQSDLILYLTPPSDEAIQRCKKDADMFVQGAGDQSELLVTVLKDEQASSVPHRVLEEALTPHTFFTIQQNAYVIEHFLRTGRPFVFEHPRSHLARSLQHLTRKIGRVRVGLALGSGAARGFAHVGVLKVLEANDIPIDMIAGTSMGAFVGGFFAGGVSALELEEMVMRYRNRRKVRRTIFDITIPLYGLSKGHSLAKFMRNRLGDMTFDDTQIPFAAVATDLSNGREVVLQHGVLWQALRASGSVPVMFEPYYLDGRYLVDGALTNPLPTDILIEQELDIIIACSVNTVHSIAENGQNEAINAGRDSESSKSAPKYGIIQALTRTMGIMSATNTLSKARLADVDIRPNVASIDWTDFHRGEELLREGEQAAQRALPALIELLHGMQS